MLPSRGLRWSSQHIGIGRRRIEAFSARKFSSSTVQHGPIRGNPLFPQTGASIRKPFTLPRSNVIILNAAAIRFASTTPSAPTAAIPSGPPPVSSVAVPPPATPSPNEFVTDLNSATDFTSNALSHMPEQLGYLKSMGLEYGYGPTAMMEWIMEHIHVYAGTPWWATIAITAVLVRAALFKFYVGSAENATRMAAVQPYTKPLTDKMRACQANGDTTGLMQYKNEISLIHKRAGIKYWKSFAPLAQAFTAYGTWVLLRAMSKLPVPGLETGGLLWFHNLTIPDPYFILPAATAGVLHWLLRRGGEMGTSTLSPGMMKAMTWGFPGLTLIFTWWLPAAVQLTFFVSGVLSFMQARAMQTPRFRQFFKMTPLATKKPTGTGPVSPYKGTMRIATPSPVLSQAKLNSRFESTTSNFPKPPSSGLNKLLNSAMKPFQEIKESTKGVVDMANERMDARREKSEKADAQRYELKRQKEEREKKRAAAAKERERRRLRKIEKMSG
ncbi:60Kd inner membrane protein-domain-containing protein [Tricladium varicosporioides]|nr:60Kd inner membrane protein-domain-containing protein [Hymenoscyphus varicosporioides]